MLALASGMATLIVGSIVGWTTWHQGRQRIDSSLLGASRAIMVAFERELDQAAALGRGLSVSANLRTGDIAGFRTEALSVVSQYGYELVLKGADGDQELHGARPPAARLRERNAAPTLRRSMIAGRWVTFIDLTLESQDGNAQYILGIGIPTVALQRLIDSQRLPGDWSPVVLDANWVIVARGQSPEKFIGEKGAGDETRNEPDDKVREVRVLEGDPSISAHSRSSRYGWTSGVSIPKSAILEQLIWPALLSAFAGFVISLVAIVAVWFFAARVVLGIRLLADATAALGKGEAIDLPTFRVDELDRVREGLQQAARSLAESKHELEARVAAATQRLNRQMEEQHRTERALAQSQRLESLGQLTGGIAHDFNNILMIVAGFLPRLKALATGDDRATQAADAIQIAVQRGASLTRQLLSFSKRQPANPEAVDVGKRLESIRHFLTSTLGPQVELKIDVLASPGAIMVDVNEFDLALLNLVLNARDAVENEGTVKISAHDVRLGADKPPHELAGAFVAVSVSDTGRGMEPEVLAKVFDPFFTTKQAGKGTGLGMSQVHGFATQSGGTAVVESAPGRGTAVTLYLPRSQTTVRETGRTTVYPIKQGVALLVDDNENVAGATEVILDQLGYDVHIANGAEQALGILDRFELDLVISDIVMPGTMNGIELARTIRERHQALPIILVTGYAGSAEKGAADFFVLRKPFDLEELRRAIQQVTEKAMAETL